MCEPVMHLELAKDRMFDEVWEQEATEFLSKEINMHSREFRVVEDDSIKIDLTSIFSCEYIKADKIALAFNARKISNNHTRMHKHVFYFSLGELVLLVNKIDQLGKRILPANCTFAATAAYEANCKTKLIEQIELKNQQIRKFKEKEHRKFVIEEYKKLETNANRQNM